MSTNAPYFGIDFGTTNSSMAWYNPATGQAETILNDHDEAITPSVVYYDEGDILVGKDAEEKIKEFEDSPDSEERDEANRRVIRSIKRNLIAPPVISIPGRKPVRPVEVVAQILGKLKHEAEEQLFREEIERVVITCPAVFGIEEQEVLLQAAATVGFHRIELVEEPTAAALAFTRLGQKVGNGVLVYDLGAGTFDLSVVVREEDGSFHIPMQPQGDPRFGGDDLDLALYRYCDGIVRRERGRPISLTEDIDLIFLRQCRSRKEILSSRKKSTFSSLLPSNNGLARFKHEIDQETFEGLIRDRIESTVDKTIKLWELVKDEVDTVLLIGGSSKVPLVKRLLAERLTTTEVRSLAGRIYVVALGAAYHAYDMWGAGEIREEKREIKEYRKALKSCWHDRSLTRTEMEWLANLVKQEFKLHRNVTERVERSVLGDNIESILKRQEPVARDRYCRVLKLGWQDKKLDALRRIPPARLNMLLDHQDRFCTFDFPDSPVKATERKEMIGGLPWSVFVMAARVTTASDMSAAAVADRLDAVADELGLSKKQAATLEHEVLGSTLREYLERQEQASRDKYREAVEKICVGGKLVKAKVDRLGALKERLGLDSRGAADVERKVLGDTVAAILIEQEEVDRLARMHKTSVSQVSGTGKLGRVTRRDVEAFIKERKRIELERSRLERLGKARFVSKLDTFGESFVEECRTNAQNFMNSDADWQKKLKDCFDPAIRSYATNVQRAAQEEVDRIGLGLKVPSFSMAKPSANAEVTAQKSHAAKIGAGIGAVTIFIGDPGIIGPLIGGGIGGLIGKRFGSDPKKKSLEAVEQAARALLPELRKDAEKYLDSVGKKMAANYR